MAMQILNNSATALALGELNKNTNRLSKDLKKVASAQKINSAGDAASEYSISEKMRVRLRALNQDEQNVQTGRSLLKVAEGAVQEQLDIMRTIKAKVIDAANDTNTDRDRATIQKEINEGYRQLEEIATETTYNGRQLLSGNLAYLANTRMDVYHAVEAGITTSYKVYDEPTKIENSDKMNVIPDVYPVLDGVEGPFDLFSYYVAPGTTTIEALGVTASQVRFDTGTSGVSGDPDTVVLDFSSYGSVSALNNVGFRTYTTSNGDKRFVMQTNPGDTSVKYNPDYTFNSISLAGVNTINAAATKIADAINTAGAGYTAVASGAAVTLKTTGNNYLAQDINRANVYTYEFGATRIPATATTSWKEKGKYTITAGMTVIGTSTGSTTIPLSSTNFVPSAGVAAGYLTGGANAYTPFGPDDPRPAKPATPASWSGNVATVADGTGVTIYDGGATAMVLQFVNGTGGFEKNTDSLNPPVNPPSKADSINYYKVGKGANATITLSGINVKISGGTLSVTTQNTGSGMNYYRVSNGGTIVYQSGTTSKNVDYEKVVTLGSTTDYIGITGLNAAAVVDDQNTATDATYAKYHIDLSPYIGKTSSSDVESFIAQMADKTITHSNGYTFKFTDSQILSQRMDRVSGIAIDLNELRKSVANGKDIASAMTELLMTKMTPQETVLYLTDTTGATTGVQIQAKRIGTSGNSETMSASSTPVYHKYVIDYNKWFASDGAGEEFPKFLYNKGFRTYCATDPDQWFNFVFSDGNDDDRPASNSSGIDIKTYAINVSGVRDAASLVKAIYEQATPILTSHNYFYNHFMRLEADPKRGLLTVYDNRTEEFTYEKYLTNLREYGTPKISDGILDTVEKVYTTLYEDKPFKENRPVVHTQALYIHDTDRANQNIHLQLPKTTLDSLLGFDPGKASYKDFHVMTKEKRTELLGTDDTVGVIDRAIDYLSDSQILLGTQIQRLEQSHANIITQQENTKAGESNIRDADMAKAMTGYTKNNVLAQAAQTMLAQANQNTGNVLSLLQ